MDDIGDKNKIYLVDKNGEKLTVRTKEEKEEQEDLKGDENVKDILNAIKRLNIILKKETWINAFEWSRKNISTVLIWISGIGAIIQINELINIHVSYIKFFSVTQLISDGALVLIMVVFTALISLITTRFLTPTMVTRQLLIDIRKNRSFNYFEKYIRYFSTFIGSILCITAFMEINAIFIQEKTLFSMFLISLMFAFLAYSGLYYSVFDDYLQKTNDKFIIFNKYNFKNLYTYFNTFMLITTVMVICIVVFKSIFLFTAASRLPYNLANYTKVTERIEKDYKNIGQYRLLYFNDTYTFIEIKKQKSDKGKIVIYKTDDIMF